MKLITVRKNLLIIATVAANVCWSMATQAATYYWDNTTPIEASGFGTAGGTWGTDALWSISNAGTANTGTSTTAAGDTVNFGTAASGLATGTITVNGTVSAGIINVGAASGALTLSGGTITLGASGNSIVNNSASRLTIGSNIDFGSVGSFRSLTGGSGGITINGNITGSGTGPRVNTSGAVTISGNITGESLQINSGTVTVGNSGLTLAAVTSNDTAAQGGTLNLNGNNLSVTTINGGITITDNAVGSGTSLLTLTGGTSSQNPATTGIISDGSNGRQVAITYNGSTTLTLSQANTYSGNTKSAAAAGKINLNNNLAIQNSAIDTSGSGTFVLGTGITTPTIGGLIGSKNLSSVITVNYGSMTALTLNPVTGQNLTYSGNITEGATGMTLTKTGAGTQILSGTGSYTGATSINSGVLIVNGTLANSAVTVQSGGTLGGSGTLSQSVNVSGTIAPGNSVGTIKTGALTLTGALENELGRSGATPVSDAIQVTGSITFSGADLKLSIASGLNLPQAGDIFYLVDNDGTDSVTGVFNKLNGTTTTLDEGSLFDWNSQQWQITYQANFGSSFSGGNDVALQVVPEPSTWMLVGFGLVGVGLMGRTFRRLS